MDEPQSEIYRLVRTEERDVDDVKTPTEELQGQLGAARTTTDVAHRHGREHQDHRTVDAVVAAGVDDGAIARHEPHPISRVSEATVETNEIASGNPRLPRPRRRS